MYVAMYVHTIEILSQIPFYTQCRLDTHDCTIVSNLYYASDVYNMDHSEMIIGMLQYCSRDSIEFACVGLKHIICKLIEQLVIVCKNLHAFNSMQPLSREH